MATKSSRIKAGSSKIGKGGRGQRKSSSLPSETVEYLKAWMMSPEHIAHPYPTEPEKAKIMADTGIEMKQLTNWFVNNRKRYWKPRVEARLQQQAQAAAAAAQAHATAVAVVTAAAQTNPVSPDQSSRSTLSLTNGNGFVNFDLSPATSEKSKSFPHLVGLTDFASILSKSDVARAVSEASSSGSVSTSEGDSDSQSEDECAQHISVEASAKIAIEQEDSGSFIQQSTGESSSPSNIACHRVTPQKSKRKVDEEEQVQTPRKKFRTVSFELWRSSCENACHAYDESLPSLEEATQLFGYVQ